MRPLLDSTAVRFALVGVVNTAFGTGVMFLAYNVFGASYWLSSALNYVLGSVLSFVLNKHYTFQTKERSLREASLFVVNIVLCYAVAYAVARPAVSLALSAVAPRVRDNAAMAVGAALFVVLNYAGQRFVVFRSAR